MDESSETSPGEISNGGGKKGPIPEQGEPQRPVERSNSGAIPTDELLTSLTLLESHEPWNRYAANAAAYTREIITKADRGTPQVREHSLEYPVQIIAEDAARSGNEELAEFLFQRMPLYDKWLVASEAFIGSEMSADHLAQWDGQLNQTVETQEDPRTVAAMHVSRISRTLQTYADTPAADPSRASLLQDAHDARRDYDSLLKAQPKRYSGQSTTLTESVARLYSDWIDLSFARVGLW